MTLPAEKNVKAMSIAPQCDPSGWMQRSEHEEHSLGSAFVQMENAATKSQRIE